MIAVLSWMEAQQGQGEEAEEEKYSLQRCSCYTRHLAAVRWGRTSGLGSGSI